MPTHLVTNKYNKNKEKRKYKFRRCAIFPEGYPSSIFAATTFNSHVRNGMALYHCAINTEIKSFMNFEKFETK